jgi:DNA-binding XRE family transcriptional regulator
MTRAAEGCTVETAPPNKGGRAACDRPRPWHQDLTPMRLQAYLRSQPRRWRHFLLPEIGGDTMSTATSFGTNVRELRIHTGMTQQQLAWASGASVSTIKRIEHGRTDPGLRIAYRIAACLDTTLANMVRR